MPSVARAFPGTAPCRDEDFLADRVLCTFYKTEDFSLFLNEFAWRDYRVGEITGLRLWNRVPPCGRLK